MFESLPVTTPPQFTPTNRSSHPLPITYYPQFTPTTRRIPLYPSAIRPYLYQSVNSDRARAVSY